MNRIDTDVVFFGGMALALVLLSLALLLLAAAVFVIATR